MNKLPENIKILLWDVNTDVLDIQKNPDFVIERVMEYGDIDEVNWLEENFSREQIVATLKKSRKISAKTGNFFARRYNVLPDETICLTKPYTQKQNRF